MAQEFNMEPIICALHGGEDYELLFTVPLSDYTRLVKINQVHIIGNMTEKSEKALFITEEGNVAEITAQGWDGLK